VVAAGRAAQRFAIVNATVVTMEPLRHRTAGRARVDEADLGIVPRASVVVEDGRVAAVGPRIRIPPGIESLDARGRVVVPGFVDAHSHALFAGNRIADFEAIAAGRAPALGIGYTVEQTRRCTPVQLAEIGAQRLSLMLSHGTTTAEVKTGYALTADGESGMLTAMSSLDRRPDMPHVVPTFCGAHAIPPEYPDAETFVAALCDRILPAVARLGIARFADAFCERGYFTPAQCERFLSACARAGMDLRVHADELSLNGGTMLAAKLRSASADHLNFADAAGIEALARAGTVAVLCPATTEYLGLERYGPARELIAAGVPVALATDFNPGTSPCPSLQTVAHLARRRLRMTAPEMLAGITAQAAVSLRREAGTIAAGAPADLVMLETADYRELGYYYGVNLVTCVTVSRGFNTWLRGNLSTGGTSGDNLPRTLP